ncbi:MAG: BREX-1 system adenine-specific DNA-methyltransferase PglX [Pseudohongiellaceae bacterium]
MNTSHLKAYAPQARRDFIAAVMARAALYGLTPKRVEPMVVQGDVAVIGERAHPRYVAASRDKLEKRIEQQGFAHVMEVMAYTWFNRFMAIRYMELHGYLDHGRRVLSHPEIQGAFQILEDCTEIELPGVDKNEVIELKLDGGKDEELYRLLLLGQCHALHEAMPFLFESIDDETELLLPDNLTKTDSLIHDLVNRIPASDWDNIEIIGWLYQFYISEKKDQVIGKVVKSEDIPAATQLFTPNWIVKYMVENSLGAQWLATYPDSKLKEKMEYYIEPAEQTDEVKTQLAAITPSQLNLEELTLIDPASGSGHILVEGYELFKAIYLERGYPPRDVPQLILEKNLFGLDIDERAAQLTGFALMMKGRADDRRLFERGVKLNVMALVDSAGFDAEVLAKGVRLSDYGLKPRDLTELKRLFEHATTFGSLIQVPEGLAEKLPGLMQLSEVTSQDLFVSEALKHLGPLVLQAELLAAQYGAVVANPPYMGNKYLTSTLKEYLKDQYKGYEKDFFSAFIDRDLAFSKPHGRLGFMSPFVWMFISTHEHLRKRLVDKETITSLVQLEYSGFEGATVPICTFTLQKGHVNGEKGCYIRLSDFRGSDNQGPRALDAIQDRSCGWFFEVAQEEFKKVPGSPLAYWVRPSTFDCFRRRFTFADVLISEGAVKTGNNDRYIRNIWEVCASDVGSEGPWRKHPKGGSYRKWYGNLDSVVEWRPSSRRHYRSDHIARIPDETNWDREGITWSAVSSSNLSFRYESPEEIANNAALFVYPRSAGELASRMACLNAATTTHFLKFISPTLNYLVGDVLAVPALQDSQIGSETASLLGAISKRDWDAYEPSCDFQSLPLLRAASEPTPTLRSSYTAWITQNRDTVAEMKRLEEENNRLFIDAYGLTDELTPEVPIEQITLTVNPAYRYGGKLTDEELWTRFRQDTMEELVSYAIGCMMGRYSVDAPGLIYAHSGNEGFDPSRYPTFPADADGIVPLTDTEWFDDDATHRIVEFMSVAWDKSHLEQNLSFLADNLGPRNNESSRETLRRYLCDSFFKNHLQTYKNRPIYWLFSSGKAKAFQCLVYLHRYNEGTLSRMRTEYVIPLQGMLASRIEQRDADILATTASSHRKKLEKERDKLVKQRAEIQKFDEKLRHYADQRIKLDLDDGVKANYGKFGDLLAEVRKVTGTSAD